MLAGAFLAPAGRASDANATFTSKKARLAFIQRAQVWAPTDVASMNLREGPAGPGALKANQLVTCDYVERHMHGASRKFYCAVAADDIVKVRYGEHNPEVVGSVLATRLLWALGFTADRVYPVRVKCRGCTSDPWTHGGHAGEVNDFEFAVVELQPPGHEMHIGDRKAGWAWPELDDVDERKGGAPIAQRDALKLLAVFMQHTDSKPQQQRMLCPPGALLESGECGKPIMFPHDVGLTFGHANTFNRGDTASVNFDEWTRTPVWKDAAGCVAHLSKSHTGTLGNPHISEAGRKFLADLLLKLSDRQLRDLFEVARVDRRDARAGDWVAAFKQKRGEIVANHCAG